MGLMPTKLRRWLDAGALVVREQARPVIDATGWGLLYLDQRTGKLRIYTVRGGDRTLERAAGGGSGDVVGPSSSVASEVALFDGTTGKLLKRAAITGLAKLTSGVLSAATAGTDYYAPGSTDVAVADGGTGASTAAGARTNLGLGGAAVLNVGTSAGTVAAGDDSRITGAAQKSANLSDLASASTARTNLGLGSAAVLNAATTRAASGLVKLGTNLLYGIDELAAHDGFHVAKTVAGAGSLATEGWANLSVSGSSGSQSNGRWVRLTSTTSAGWSQGTRLADTAEGFVVVIAFKLPTTIGARRLYIGLCSTTVADSDTPSGHFVGLRYSSTVPDAGFVPASRDGTTTTIGSAFAAPVADAPYLAIFTGTAGGSVVVELIRLDTGSRETATISATLPAGGTKIDVVLYGWNQGVSKAIEMSYVKRYLPMM